MAYTETDLAYTAGIIDGEGCIGLYKHKGNGCKVGYSYALTVTVGMSDSTIPTWLKSNFGGSLLHYKGTKLHWRDRYIWRVCAEKARQLLIAILPYLKLKGGQAELAIEFQTIRYKNTGKWHSYTPKPLVVIEAEAILAKRVQILNKG